MPETGAFHASFVRELGCSEFFVLPVAVGRKSIFEVVVCLPEMPGNFFSWPRESWIVLNDFVRSPSPLEFPISAFFWYRSWLIPSKYLR
jgi:hypothetical protein